MLKRHTQIFYTVMRLFDMTFAFAAWELAYLLRFIWVDFPSAVFVPKHLEYLKAAFFVAILTAFVFSFTGVYRMQKVNHLRHEFYHLLRGTFTLFLVTLVAAFFYRDFSYSRVHTIYFLICYLFLLFLSRIIIRWGLEWLHEKGKHVENILLIGGGVTASKFVHKLERFKTLGIVLIGAIETDSKIKSDIPENIPILGGIDEISSIIQTKKIDLFFLD